MKHQAPVTVQLMGDDQQDVVSYRRKLAALTGSVSAAILLSRILKWAKLKNYEPFYKFREPCKHDKYVAGDSWVEDIEFTAAEFDNALKVIGTKLKKGTKRADVEAVDYPMRVEGESDADYLKRFQFALQHLVIYWTDNNRVTWYELNSALLDKFTNSIYLDSCSSVKYLRSRVFGVILKDRKLNSSRKIEEVEIHSSDQTPDQTPKEEKIDHARASSFSNTSEDQSAQPDDDYTDEQRHADFEATRARLMAEGYDPAEPPAPLPPVESTPIPFHMANGLGLVDFKHPYWLAYQQGGVAMKLETRTPVDVQSTIRLLEGMDAKPDEVECAVQWRGANRIAKTLYRFAFVPEDVRQYRETLLPPLERDAELAAAVQAAWKYAVGSEANNRLVDFLSGNVRGDMHRLDWGKLQFRADPLSASEVTKFAAWYKVQFKDRATPPETAKTLRERIEGFRAQRTVTTAAPTPKLTALAQHAADETDTPEAKAAALAAARQQLSGVLR